MTNSIETLKARVEALSDQLDDARYALRLAQVAAAEFQVGDIVEVFKQPRGARYGAQSGWQEAIIREVDPSSWSTHYSVSYKNKGGEWSKFISRVYGDIRLHQAP